MEPQSFTNLGGIPRQLDVRDFSLGAATPPGAFPATFMQDRAFQTPIYYQGRQAACGAHAGAWLKSFLGAIDTPSPHYTWEDIKTFDGFPATDGTDMRSIFKSLARGSMSLVTVPNDVNVPIEQYAAPADLTDQNRALAGQDIIDAYAFEDAPSFNRVKQLISEHGAVLLLIALGPEFWTATNGQTSYAEADILPLRTPAQVTSHHFIVAHSYDNQYVYFSNSFGAAWGRNGHGYFDANYMPYVLEAGTAIDHEKAVLASQKLGLLSNSLLEVGDPRSQLVQQLAKLMMGLRL